MLWGLCKGHRGYVWTIMWGIFVSVVPSSVQRGEADKGGNIS